MILKLNYIMNINKLIPEFIKLIEEKKIELYNEAGIQFELAIFLREKLSSNYKIELERNLNKFNPPKNANFKKKEIDIVIYNEKKKLAIELKCPTNGQYPEQMFSFAKDINFLEELNVIGFKKNLFITFAKDKLFWIDKGEKGKIYYQFRKQKKLGGRIQKPTGKSTMFIHLKKSYSINWIEIKNTEWRYFLVEV